jgi:V8-like Glu-specific endopeptidase
LRTSVLIASLIAAVFSTSACAKLRGLRSTQSAPTPAALSNEGRGAPESHPPSLARDDDSIVRLVAGQVTCSGTLIEADRVLTAHHCVARRNRDGEIMKEDVRPTEIRVEVGGDYLPYADVGVRAIVAPTCGHATGEGDIAILILDKKLPGVATLDPRLDRGPKVGQQVSPVGFGRCALSSDGIRRRYRAGGAIQTLTEGRFRLQAAICPGDSGGPALNEDGQLIGVISASVMDGSEQTRGESEFTRLDYWLSVFGHAKLIAEGSNPAELPPIDCPAK